MLEGVADFFRVKNGKAEWVRCEVGDVMILPPNSLHGFYNRGSYVCRLLGISAAVHETFLDAVSNADRISSFARMAPKEAMSKIAQIAMQNYIYFAPIDISQTDRLRP